MAFLKPQKRIGSQADIPAWFNSESYYVYMKVLTTLNEAIRCHRTSDSCLISESVLLVINVLETIEKWIDDIPLQNLQFQRFGNKAFRQWHAKLIEEIEELLFPVLNESTRDAIVEIVPYFVNSFGDASRIDYGSGHEASFLMFICCLFQLKIFNNSDYMSIPLRLFNRYMHVVRKLQTIYRMEPAGSHGVHSLDDFQFIPFIWGSAQLLGRNDICLVTDSYVHADVINRYPNDNLFFDAIKYINETKTGLFCEHSNKLWNISSVSTWDKINSGLFKMYKGEVLGKFPIIQHFLFGSLLSFDEKCERTD